MPSQATMSAITTDFSISCLKNGGFPDIQSQFNHIEHFDQAFKGGVCNGLSIRWLEDQRNPGRVGVLQQLQAGVLNGPGKKAFVDHIEAAHKQQGGKTDINAEVGPERRKAFMRTLGFIHTETKIYGGGWGKGHSDLGKYIAIGGYFILNVPKHAMAAASIGGIHRFYDPNIGSVSFTTGDKMGAFFSKYFKNSIMMAQYGTEGHMNKLQVNVERYTG